MIQPEKFGTNPYGWLTNQLSHIGLGVFLVFLLCFGGFLLLGEFPYRLHVFALILTGYIVLVEMPQGWRGWDTCEDTIMVACYGAGAPLVAFYEVKPGSPEFAGEIVTLAPFFYVAGVHLFAGFTHRLYAKRSSKD